MWNRFPPSPTSGNESNPEHQAQLNALIAMVNDVIVRVNDIAENLKDPYPEYAFDNLSREFEQISKDFTNHITIRRDPFNIILNKSRDRQNFAKAVANEAKKLARLFEGYARSPKSYRVSSSRIEINKLQAQLQNLLSASSF